MDLSDTTGRYDWTLRKCFDTSFVALGIISEQSFHVEKGRDIRMHNWKKRLENTETNKKNQTWKHSFQLRSLTHRPLLNDARFKFITRN
jgi:hypothetical protein